MSNKFCRALSNRILFTNVGSSDSIKYKPCCFFTKEFEITSLKEFQATSMIVGAIKDWTPFCQKCKTFENSGSRSFRQEVNQDYIENPNDGIDIEIQMDKTCNAACITCGDWSSTTWQKYNNNIKNISTKLVIKPDTESNISKIKDIIDFDNLKINSITFLGGEPFANKNHIRILECISNNVSKNITLEYITNGSYLLDKECYNEFKRFNSIAFMFSLDGYKDIFDYHRWPLKWNTIEENFINLLEEKFLDFTVSVGSTLTPLNIFYFDQLETWVNKLSLDYKKEIELNFWPAYGTMSLNAVTPDYRKLLETKYANNQRILNYLKSQPYAEYSHNEFLKHINFHDPKRKLSWKETFPDLIKFYQG